MGIHSETFWNHYQPWDGRKWPLLPLEWGYSFVVSLRQWLYQAQWIRPVRVPIPVISVGNLTTGGTGKTPMVLAIAEYLGQQGKKVVVLSRGYGAKRPQAYCQATHPDFGEEAYFLQQRLPQAVVIVGADRANNARRVVEDHQPDVILLDDGFQYLRLARDLNILLVDGNRLWGNGHLLPLGPLREPVSQINRANQVWLTKHISESVLQKLTQCVYQYHPTPSNVGVETIPFDPIGFFHPFSQKILPVESLQGQEGVAVSGIADPTQFEENLKACGIIPTQHLIKDDHHLYTPAEVREIEHCAQGQPVFTTDKDWVKLAPLMSEALQQAVYTLQLRPILPESVQKTLDAVIQG